MNTLDLERSGPWRELFERALELTAELERRVPGAAWSFGGGTVLMLRIDHRQSRDIDLFVPDPQYLGYVSPRLNDVAESISADYEQAAEYLKLFLPGGEIDVVVGTPLTERPFDLVEYRGRTIKVETSGEIVAKKMWHRGDRAKARDLFDLCAVDRAEPEQVEAAKPWMARHGAAFLDGLSLREALLRREFEEIDAIGPRMSFEECFSRAERIIRSVLRGTGA
ncbi:nucleotidyl transferase AbiEii/AbiGii toxin family protein [Lysobacter enzymogenes]|uniref:Nucleotidyl transferase AbiEii/AbiGii toxin family protein n=1 Tax=Lysobacter enzymogenes TaxID=69 RepID=A0A3N2RKW3_LYSEN|nr:nucleotidyl transferase AbiEii/AbiGii toxin family protein [Lysobacter enzymogenes]ROU08024.1 nucleotidyl transferase AbiEii/AbiGii toxin family protein [Lysobacter enzymogenes]